MSMVLIEHYVHTCVPDQDLRERNVVQFTIYTVLHV